MGEIDIYPQSFYHTLFVAAVALAYAYQQALT